jgi:hypothetical protein
MTGVEATGDVVKNSEDRINLLEISTRETSVALGKYIDKLPVLQELQEAIEKNIHGVKNALAEDALKVSNKQKKEEILDKITSRAILEEYILLAAKANHDVSIRHAIYNLLEKCGIKPLPQ